MVKSSKTGRELTPQRGTKVPERVRWFFGLLGFRQPGVPDATEYPDDDSDA